MSQYDRQGRPLTIEQWARLLEDPDYKRVAEDTVTHGKRAFWVSTVWLGYDHQCGAGPPLIYETMIFENGMEGDCQRYAIEAEALAGHRKIVEELRREQSE